ncbi:uncharacterized protein LOC110913718 [Helianthus annuus]|uniref:uncharacterized protein LOC110913718 n=1 Tax=Helianthus annuus TaxID=4232 RepID=UPI000B900D2F|nr:uncharacterized protein LOC110913718 [Helianthus annuus]
MSHCRNLDEARNTALRYIRLEDDKKMILVDNGSSVNIMQLETLKRMNVSPMDITSKSTVLVGLNGEVKNTVGEIKLPVYVEGVNSMQRFCVMDSLSCYNIILGRTWIHDMKAVPSTYD